jgi:hypothetical protein
MYIDFHFYMKLMNFQVEQTYLFFVQNLCCKISQNYVLSVAHNLINYGSWCEEPKIVNSLSESITYSV